MTEQTEPQAGDPPKTDPPKATPGRVTTGGPTEDDIAKLQQALDRERALRKDADRAAKEGAAAKSRLDELEAESRTDLEREVAAARKEGAAQALAAATARIVASEARALAAAARFRDPGDAVRFLDLSEVAVTDDGVVDASDIGGKLEQLAKDKPYLIVEQVPPIPTPAQAGIGVGGESSRQVAPGMDRLRSAYAASTPNRK